MDTETLRRVNQVIVETGHCLRWQWIGLGIFNLGTVIFVSRFWYDDLDVFIDFAIACLLIGGACNIASHIAFRQAMKRLPDSFKQLL